MAKTVILRNGRPGYPDEFDAGSSGSSITLTGLNGYAQKLTLTADCAITMSNLVGAAAFVLRVVQDSTPRTISFTNVDFGHLGIPDISSLAAGDYVLINIYRDSDGNLAGSAANGYSP